MTIYRNGEEIELTFGEMIRAYDEYKLDCMIEDVRSILASGTRDIELSDKQVEEIASRAVHNLGKNDSYYEAYWMSVEYTLDDYIQEMEGN